MILRIARSLRAHAFLFVALLGVALLLLGVFEWWRFYRDLYIEERAALEEFAAVAGDAGSVSYLRAGSPTQEWTSLDQAPPMPWGTPFVGRLEGVDATFSEHVPEATLAPARERLMRLSGTRLQQEFHAELSPSTRPLDLERALGRPLPAFEPPIDEAEAKQPIPRGDPLDEAKAETIWKAVRDSWLKEPEPQGPYLAVFEDSVRREAEIHDGQRRWTYSRHYTEWYEDVPPEKYDEQLTLTHDGVTHILQADGDAWRITYRIPADLSKHLDEPRFRSSGLTLGLDRMRFPEGQVVDVLRPESIERLDSARYRISFAPCVVVGAFGMETNYQAIEVVVRSDMEWALERSRLESADGHVHREICRLERAGDFIYCADSLSTSEGPQEDPWTGRWRYAIELGPTNCGAAFDLGSYGVRPWPDPELLPALRAYRVLLLLGGLTTAIGVVGGTALRLRRRRRPAHGERTQSASGRRTARRPAFRFGFLTLGAAALLLISLSGWYKSKLDVLREEDYLLRSSEGATSKRVEPNSPWSLLATETFPLDAPLREVRIADLSIDVRDRMLKSPTIERYENYPAYSGLFRTTGLPASSLGTPTPKIGEATIEDSELEAPLPRGEELSPAETRDLESRLHAAWRKGLERKPPARYCVVRERRAPPEQSAMNYQGVAAYQARLELRDGDRYWRAFAGVEDLANVACGDGVWAYRYARQEPSGLYVNESTEWTLAARYPRGSERFGDPLPEIPRDADLHRSRDNDAPLTAPPLPGWFESVGTDLLSRSLGEGLAKMNSLPSVLHAERLGAGRYLVEFEPPRLSWEFPSGKFDLDPWRGTVGISRWTIVANENLDWAIEVSDVEANPREAHWRDRNPPLGRSATRTVSRIERFDGEAYLVESRTRARDLPGWRPEDRVVLYSSAFAYDFSPAIDDRIFRLPSLDYPHPPPDPVPEPIFAWWMATGAVACGGFVFAGVARIREARRGGREGRGDRDGKEAQDGTGDDESSSEAAESTASEVAT